MKRLLALTQQLQLKVTFMLLDESCSTRLESFSILWKNLMEKFGLGYFK